MVVRLALLLAFTLTGCAAAESLVVNAVYDRVECPGALAVHDVRYAEGSERHRLNLFLPRAPHEPGATWPVVVFVHGGGWTEGSKDLTFGGEDLYGNIGRFFAAHGIGAAVVNYRLLPEVAWPDQVDDVARAVAWVHEHIALYGGDPEALFLMGHSAGAQLATRVALDPEALPPLGVPMGAVCGVIPVSGAALDLTDRRSFELADNFRYYARRFGPPGDPLPPEPPAEPFAWQREASPIRFASADAPPFLIAYAGGESRALQRQSHRLDAALREAGAESRVVVAPGLSHIRIVPTLSQEGAVVAEAAIAFVRAQSCS